MRTHVPHWMKAQNAYASNCSDSVRYPGIISHPEERSDEESTISPPPGIHEHQSLPRQGYTNINLSPAGGEIQRGGSSLSNSSTLNTQTQLPANFTITRKMQQNAPKCHTFGENVSGRSPLAASGLTPVNRLGCVDIPEFLIVIPNQVVIPAKAGIYSS